MLALPRSCRLPLDQDVCRVHHWRRDPPPEPDIRRQLCHRHLRWCAGGYLGAIHLHAHPMYKTHTCTKWRLHETRKTNNTHETRGADQGKCPVCCICSCENGLSRCPTHASMRLVAVDTKPNPCRLGVLICHNFSLIFATVPLLQLSLVLSTVYCHKNQSQATTLTISFAQTQQQPSLTISIAQTQHKPSLT